MLNCEYFIYVLGALKNHLIETVLLSTHNIDTLSKKLESVYTATLSKQPELEVALAKMETELKEALDVKKNLENQK